MDSSNGMNIETNDLDKVVAYLYYYKQKHVDTQLKAIYQRFKI